jgi:hypothetical protein
MGLVELYGEITELTKPICAACDPPHHCCAPVGCGQAMCWARGVYGIDLERTSDNPLSAMPYLTKSGCSVAPIHRPLCSLWLCPQGEDRAPMRYWELKAEIMEIEVERFKLGKEIYAKTNPAKVAAD